MLKNLQNILRGGVEQALLRLWSTRLSEAEAAAIRSRAEAVPKYREELLGALEAHARMEELADDPAIRAIADESAELSMLTRSRRQAGYAVAASVVLAISAALAYFARSNSYGPQPYDPSRWDAKGRVFFLELNWEFGAGD